MKKKFTGKGLWLLCVFTLALAMLPLTGGKAWAEPVVLDASGAYVGVDTGIKYSLNDGADGVAGTATVTGYTADFQGGDVEIQSIVTYGGTEYTVTEISGSAFRESSLESITVPSSVTSIGDAAFFNCSSLKSVNLSAASGVASIGKELFLNCAALTTVNLPNAVTSIGDSAFGNCDKLKTINMPNDLQTIGKEAFSGCKALPTVELLDGVTSIGELAFYKCSSLTSINLPDGMTSIGDNAFKECQALTAIKWPSGVTSIGKELFLNCTSLATVSLPEGVISIGESAFSGCTNLTGIDLPNSLESIGAGAFSGSGLDSIILPNKVTTINDRVFLNCKSLTSIDLPNSITSIGKSAFSGSGLESIVVPKSVTSIGEYAFNGCTGLTEIDLPDDLTNIGEYAFNGCTGLTEIDLPKGLTKIGGYAFNRCTGLTEIDLFNTNVTSIEFGTFKGCENLASIKLPKGLESIGEYAFAECGLTEIDLFNTDVTSIEFGTFKGCSQLASIKLPKGLTEITDGENHGEWHNEGAFENCKKLTSIDLPEGLTKIGSNAFNGCIGLTEITVPDNVTTIGETVFKNCPDLASIFLPGTVTNIGTGAFEDCTNLRVIITGDKVPDDLSAFANVKQVTCTNPALIEELAEGLGVAVDDIKQVYDLDTVTISLTPEKIIYTSQPEEPAVTLSPVGETKFTQDKDYTLDYSYNTELGKGTVTIKSTNTGQLYGKEKTAEFTIYSVTFLPGEGTGETKLPTMVKGLTVTLPGSDFFTAPEGKEFKGWQIAGDDTVYQLGDTYPVKGNLTFTAVWGGDDTDPDTPTDPDNPTKPVDPSNPTDPDDPNNPDGTYTITFDTAGGTLAAGATEQVKVTANQKITMPNATKSGYTLKCWQDEEDENKNYAVNNAYSFAADTDLIAIWDKNSSGGGHSSRPGSGTTTPVKPEKPGTTNPGTPGTSSNTVTAANINNVFADVQNNAWYAEAIAYVYNKGIMNGTGNGQFEPNASTTRAMLVTMLHRLEKEPGAGAINFGDVASGQWYSQAIAWAANNGIVKGYSETQFAPNDEITREQLAVILYRYAQFKGLDVSAKGDLSGFSDSQNVSDWAKEAVEWAVGAGIISGNDKGNIAPTANATRAEVAMMLMRFLVNT